jgi:predicted CXXCH cytochrome family protein
MDNGLMLCSTCHDQHSQAALPFGQYPPPYDPVTQGVGRNYMRIDNSRCEMCAECHAGKTVTDAAAGSHPVGVGANQFDCLFCHNFRVPLNPQAVPMGSDHEIECLTCHQMHLTPATNGMILVATNINLLCIKCHHDVADTASPAAHLSSSNSNTLWPGGQYGSVCPPKTDPAQRGTCLNCHQVHGWPNATNTATRYPGLLADAEENLCFTCHDTDGPAVRQVTAEFNKPSRHPLTMAAGVHRFDEPALVTNRHVECADCHDPHRAKARVSLPGPALVPRPASGPLAGVRGVNTAGAEVNPAAYEYQVCFRCHADSPGQPAPPTPRQFTSINVRLEFSGSMTSAHPVAVRGNNPYVPSLIGGWTTNSIMACTACHNNDAGPNNGGPGPNGPHGSTNSMLLERTCATADGTPYAQAAYALCFKCHSATSVMGDVSFHEHTKHIIGESTPCNVCHDPHASPQQSRLINFDTSVVTPSQANGRLEFRSTGQFSGQCSLTCHNKDHDAQTYQP